ncbi:hypothetical protein F66182_3759 [Fusarium sp. NRRL 66182]|nr:hypothetical protein F66182_3759 [Fusarium sp. NRRL 66182]
MPRAKKIAEPGADAQANSNDNNAKMSKSSLIEANQKLIQEIQKRDEASAGTNVFIDRAISRIVEQDNYIRKQDILIKQQNRKIKQQDVEMFMLEREFKCQGNTSSQPPTAAVSDSEKDETENNQNGEEKDRDETVDENCSCAMSRASIKNLTQEFQKLEHKELELEKDACGFVMGSEDWLKSAMERDVKSELRRELTKKYFDILGNLDRLEKDMAYGLDDKFNGRRLDLILSISHKQQTASKMWAGVREGMAKVNEFISTKQAETASTYTDLIRRLDQMDSSAYAAIEKYKKELREAEDCYCG